MSASVTFHLIFFSLSIFVALFLGNTYLCSWFKMVQVLHLYFEMVTIYHSKAPFLGWMEMHLQICWYRFHSLVFTAFSVLIETSLLFRPCLDIRELMCLKCSIFLVNCR